MKRYLIVCEEPCTACDGTGENEYTEDGACLGCDGTGVTQTEIDATDWLRSELPRLLVELGMVSDGK